MRLTHVSAMTLAVAATAAFAQDAANYPNRPIRLIVPQAVVNRLSAQVARIVKLPDVAQRFELDGAEGVGSTPAEFAAFLKAEMQKWSKVIKDAGIKAEQ
jgi:tripartite-type tricarboxylate transporter receptor subunit TctC